MTARSWATLAEVLALAAWLGGGVLFAAVVAPAAFTVLPSRALAGALAGRMLPVIFYAGILLGLAIVGAEWATRGSGGGWTRLAAGAVVCTACAVAQWVVGTRIERVRRSISGAIEALDPADPRRVAFGRLHAASVGWLGLAMLAALVALVAAARALSVPTSSPPSP